MKKNSKKTTKKVNIKKIVLCALCTIALIATLAFGAFKLNLIKLKGSPYELYETGDEFCLGSECFNVIEEKDDGTVVALAKYNLYVGKNIRYDTDLDTFELINEITPDEVGYGLQNSLTDNDNQYFEHLRGIVNFSDTAYWIDSSTGKTDTKYENHGTNEEPKRYVYDENSNLYNYVEEYKSTLNNAGYNVKAARLLSVEDADYIDANTNDISKFTNTFYWTGNSEDDNECSTYIYISMGGSNGRVIDWPACDNYDKYGLLGLKPVIEIDKSDIPGNTIVFDGCTEFTPKDSYEFGETIAICNKSLNKSEDFRVVDEDDDYVYALAEYNLVGGNIIKLDSDGGVAKTISVSTTLPGYGLQSSTFAGVEDANTYYGVIGFSETNYWDGDSNYPRNITTEGSNLDSYLTYYETYLNGLLDTTNVSVDLLDGQLLIDQGCAIGEPGGCATVPEWLYQTSYWTRTAITNDSVYVVVGSKYISGGGLISLRFDQPIYIGIRPVIKVSKNQLKPSPSEDPDEETTTEESTTEHKEDSTTKETTKATTKGGSDKTTKKQATTKAVNKNSNTNTNSVVNANKLLTNNTTTKKASNNKVTTKKLVNNISTVKTSNGTNWLLILLSVIAGILFITFIILAATNKNKKEAVK